MVVAPSGEVVVAVADVLEVVVAEHGNALVQKDSNHDHCSNRTIHQLPVNQFPLGFEPVPILEPVQLQKGSNKQRKGSLTKV